MPKPLFLLFLLFSIWRVGDYVNWDIETVYDKLRNDIEKPYEPPEDTCPTGGEEHSVIAVFDRWRCWFVDFSNRFKEAVAFKIQEVLPSPHSELVMGMVLGENKFKMVPRYNDVVKKVGLVHVAVSLATISGRSITPRVAKKLSWKLTENS